MKKTLISLLCFIICGTMISGGIRIMAENKALPLYKESGVEETALHQNAFAVQFAVTKPFCRLDIRIIKADKSENGVMDARLYKWAGSYQKTLNEKPVVSASLSGFEDNTDAPFDTGSQPAGEYILYLYGINTQTKLGLAESAGARTYYNASVHPKSLMASVVWDGEEGGLSGVSDNTFEFVESADTWVVTDGLGRVVSNSETDTRRQNKTVGLFFHTWHTSNSSLGSRNITEILKEHPEIQNDFTSKLWGTAGAYHWNEPIWGYYRSSDEWVLRKQAELLADAGVDAVFFDNTNGTATFIDDVLTLCRVWSQARADGVKTPQISFMLPMFDYGLVATQLREIYSKLYGKGIYKELWFNWKGKPLIVGCPIELDKKNATDKAILDLFNFRVINHSQSSDNVQVQDENGEPLVMGAIQQEVKRKYQLWNWISVYPQLVNKNKDGTPEQVAVAIAHNWCKETHLTAMNNPKFQVFGRHYDPKNEKVDERENAKLYGKYFETQWEYALDIDPEFIWVTGWNEWVAGRFEDFWGVKNAFPDNFSDEYSRDIEPSKGDLKDHYYYQLVNYIRKYKGVSALPAVDEPVTVDIKTGDGWDRVTRVYETYGGDTFDRQSPGYVNNATMKLYRYSNKTGRNDIVLSKATYDAENVYFMAETKNELTPYTDPAWMRLLIEVEKADGNEVKADSWESFQYIINRNAPKDGEHTALERSKGGWEWENAGEVSYNASGNRLQIAVPRALLGLDGCKSFTLNFKWSDNMQNDGDILDFYENGDAAPEGRYKYQLSVVNSPDKAAAAETDAKTDAPQTTDTEAAETYDGEKSSKITMVAAIGGAALAVGGGLAAAVVIKKKKERK